EERPYLAPLDRRRRRSAERKPTRLRAHQVRNAEVERLERDWNLGCRRGGIAQGFDGAAIILYVYYRHASGELNLRQINGLTASGPITNAPIDDLDLLMSGAVVRF